MATFVGTVSVGSYATNPGARAAVASVLRDPVMDLPGPFPNCAAAQAAGWYSIPRGSPAYLGAQDADGDGFACEPYRSVRFGASLDRRLKRLRTLVR